MTLRAEFLASFVPPPSVDRAYTFGHKSGRAGYGRLSFAEFFANEDQTEGTITWRTSIYGAYRKGHKSGKRMYEAGQVA